MRRGFLAAAMALCVIAPATAEAKVKWLCAPDVKSNPCVTDMKTTVFSAYDQQLRIETPRAARKPKIDCFYVYPTVSNQNTDVATKAIDPEIRSIALFQAARFSQVCRVFAPIYRQVTVPALNRAKYIAGPGDKDLLEAWKVFLARHSKGRGFVLIGHSQGTFRLITLIQKQIDKNAKLRKRLVSALLLGGRVTVDKGSDRGGSFLNVPACKDDTQLHCVVAFSTYNQTPPDDNVFGRAADPTEQVLCTNPAGLRGGPVDLDSIMPTTPFASGFIAAGIQILHFPPPKASTPFVQAKAAFSGECVVENDSSFLKITSKDGTPVPDPSPTPAWGLHLLDGNVAQGDLLRLVRAQTREYLN